jgi:hypothetical protein
LKIIMIVACDLGRDENGKIIVGPETKIACDRAISLADNDRKTIIAITAGETPGKRNPVVMSDVMADYLLSARPMLCNGRLIRNNAWTFNTDGEMRALVDLLYRRPACSRIILAVKWWHAPRAWALCKYRLFKARLQIPVSISWCYSEVAWTLIAKEFFFAIPNNILRIIVYG